MAALMIKLDYQELQNLGSRFNTSASTVDTLSGDLKDVTSQLRRAWTGSGSAAFISALDDLIPSVERLSNALYLTNAMIAQISQIMQTAEQAAAALFTEMGTFSADLDSHSVFDTIVSLQTNPNLSSPDNRYHIPDLPSDHAGKIAAIQAIMPGNITFDGTGWSNDDLDTLFWALEFSQHYYTDGPYRADPPSRDNKGNLNVNGIYDPCISFIMSVFNAKKYNDGLYTSVLGTGTLYDMLHENNQTYSLAVPFLLPGQNNDGLGSIPPAHPGQYIFVNALDGSYVPTFILHPFYGKDAQGNNVAGTSKQINNSLKTWESIQPGSIIIHQSTSDMSYGEYPHATLVVGWGAANLTASGNATLYSSFQAASAAGVQAVPYVVDRGYGTETGYRGPRPFNDTYLHPDGTNAYTTNNFQIYNIQKPAMASATPVATP